MKLSKYLYLFTVVLFAALFLQSCEEDEDLFTVSFEDAPAAYDTTSAIRDTTLPGGIKVYVYKEGTGPFTIVSKDQLVVKFTARDESGRIIDSSYNNRSAVNTRVFYNLTPTPIVIGGRLQLLVEGLRRALIGMKVGAIRTIVIPADLAFNLEYISKTGRSGPILTSSLDLLGETIRYDIEIVRLF